MTENFNDILRLNNDNDLQLALIRNHLQINKIYDVFNFADLTVNAADGDESNDSLLVKYVINNSVIYCVSKERDLKSTFYLVPHDDVNYLEEINAITVLSKPVFQIKSQS